MREMKRFRFNGVIEVPADTFAGEFDSEPDGLLTYAFEHGDASGDFFTYVSGDTSVEDYYEYEETEWRLLGVNGFLRSIEKN